MKISNEQLKKLNYFCGSGDFPNANIIFFGNEEGLGGKKLKEVIENRCNLYDNKNTIKLSNNKNIYYRKDWESDKKAINSSMLQFQARILLFLNNPKGNWFVKKGDDPDIFEQIKEYQRSQLYRECNNYKFKSALIDLRPLPRFVEKCWPYENVNECQYLKAFQFNIESGIGDKLLHFRNERAQIIKNLFDTSKKINVIVGIGDKKTKRNLFEKSYNAKFLEIIEGKCFQSQIQLNGQIINIFLSNFFDYQVLGLKNLEKLAHLIKECY